MRSLKSVLALVLFLLTTATFIFPDDSKIRVTATKANIRLKPNSQSAIVSTVPLGAVLEVIKKEANWYFVKLPPDEKGIVVTGYIHQNIVEVIKEMESPVKPEEEPIEKNEVVEPEKKLQKVVSKAIESPKELSQNPDYLRWKEKYNKAERNFKSWKKYVYIGQAGFGAGVLINILTSVTAKEDYLTGVIIGSSVALGGVGLWLYAANRRGSAKEKMDLLMNEGRIKKYIGAYINPREKCYVVTFVIAF